MLQLKYIRLLPFALAFAAVSGITASDDQNQGRKLCVGFFNNAVEENVY